MSSSNTNSSSSSSARKVPPANPYARKNPYAKSSSNRNGASTMKQTRSEAAKVVVTAAASDVIPTGANTFGDAFASLEGTRHYQSPSKSKQSTILQQQQRDFDTQAMKDEAARLDARDQHVLLQPHVLYVSTKQRGNGVLRYIRNVPFAFSKMVPDYILSSQRCALFLSLKYHSLYPNYIHKRTAELKTDFALRVLLVLVDVSDNANALLFLNKFAVIHNFTLILSWTEEEAARYLETYKALDGKDASSIQKREQTNFVDQCTDFLTTARAVNKTDAGQLLSQFGSVRSIMAASVDELSLCPGVGEKKVRRLWAAFHQPFSSLRAKKRKLDRERGGEQEETKEGKTINGEENGDEKDCSKKPSATGAT